VFARVIIVYDWADSPTELLSALKPSHIDLRLTVKWRQPYGLTEIES